jgi:hypothetical protein
MAAMKPIMLKAKKILKQIYDRGVLKLNGLTEHKSQNFSIFILHNNLAEEVELKDVFTIQSAYKYAQNLVNERKDVDGEILLSTLEDQLKQNIFYDQKNQFKG